MEFRDVVRRRRMVRNFHPRPIDPAVVERILRHGHQAPSAGFTQGYAFLTFQGEQTEAFWRAASPEGGPPDFAPGLGNAALIIVPLASKQAYLDRYAESDKGWTDRDENRWSAPYWYVDTAFASLLMLLTAVDEGLGALFFGIFPAEHVARFCETFGIPEGFEPIGAIAVGHPAPDSVQGSARSRPRKALEELVHEGRW